MDIDVNSTIKQGAEKIDVTPTDKVSAAIGRCYFIREWDDWEKSIHADKAQVQRQGTAMTYHFDFLIDDVNEVGTFSSTSDLPYYMTSLSRCTCYDFRERKLPCKHIYRLAVELGIIEIIRRPSFNRTKIEEIKNSDNIDEQPEQIKRIERAKEKKCAPMSIDYDAKTAIFAGSGKMPYETTISTCTCRDFFTRRLPCKHIYRLRMDLDAARGKAK